MKPIPVQKAAKWYLLTRFGYFFLCWNAFIITYFFVKRGERQLLPSIDINDAHYWARNFGAERAIFFGIDSKGIHKVEYDGVKYSQEYKEKFAEARKAHIANEII